ncbi:MAG: hypothetical protein GWP06_13750 [Actinobacteria bacterium]|nr:hypothetical protein [Actinomycetota bacterium]
MKTTALTLLAALVVLLACSKNPVNEEQPQQPALPPAGSMTVDLSTFGKTLAKPAETTLQDNFNNAAIRVAFVNSLVFVNMAIPTALFAAAITQNPILKDDAKFHWVYQQTIGLTTYEADLAGWVDVNTKRVNWEMYVTNPKFKPVLSKFKWYDGWTNPDNNSGQWTFYNPQKPDVAERMLTINWEHNSAEDANLAFANVWDSHAEKGDTLRYVVKDTDRSILFYDNSENLTWTIFWNAVTTAGYLHVPGYNNGEPAYWDKNHNDIQAP